MSDTRWVWLCRVQRSHGTCHGLNEADDSSCGACGEDRPVFPVIESTSPAAPVPVSGDPPRMTFETFEMTPEQVARVRENAQQQWLNRDLRAIAAVELALCDTIDSLRARLSAIEGAAAPTMDAKGRPLTVVFDIAYDDEKNVTTYTPRGGPVPRQVRAVYEIVSPAISVQGSGDVGE